MPLLFDNHPADSRITGPVGTCQTLSSRMGTGGGQCADHDSVGGGNFYWMTDKAGHLCRFTKINKCNTLQATDYKDPPVIVKQDIRW